MGIRMASVSSKTLQNVSAGNSVEAVVLTSPPINLSLDNALVVILWEVEVTLGAAQTSFNVNVRRGTTITGTLVNSALPITTVASTHVLYSGTYIDTPGIVAGQQYSVCLTINGAAGAASITDGCITAIVL